MTRLRKLAAQTFLALAAAALGTSALAEETATVIAPLQVASDQNNVNLHDGRTTIDGPVLAVPGAPNLRFDRVQNAAPYMTGRITSAPGADHDQRTYAVHIGAAGAEAFDCFDGECVSVAGSGATLVRQGVNPHYYTQPGSGAVWNFNLVAVHTTGTPQSLAHYASQVTYPNGETITYAYQTAQPGLPFNRILYRPTTLTSNLGYHITITYQSADPNSPQWEAVSVASLYHSGTSTLLGQLTFSGNTITDISGRTYACTGCVGGLGQDIEIAAGSLQLPGEGTPAVQVAQHASATVVASVTRDGVAYTYSYDNLRLQAGTTRYIFDHLTVDGPNGFHQVYDITNTYIAQRPRTRIARSTDPLGRQTNYYYDSSDRPIRMVLPEGNEAQVTYDYNGNIVSRLTRAKPGSGQADITESASYPAGACASVLCWRPTWTRDGLGRQTDYAYSAAGQLTERTEPADANGVRRRTCIEYAASPAGLSRPVAVTIRGDTAACGTSGGIRTEYQYALSTDPLGNTGLPILERRIDSAGGAALETAFTYDNAGRLRSTDGPLSGSGDASYVRYDSLGRKTWEIGAVGIDGFRIGRRYDYRPADDRVNYVETGTIYNATFNPTSPTDPSFTTIHSRSDFAYDSHRNPVRESVTASGAIRSVVQSSYDDRGRLECQAVRMNPAIFASPPASACDLGTQGTGANAFGPDRITRNTWDAASQLLQVQRAWRITTANGFPATLQQNYATYTYSANGQRTSVTDANGNKASMTYDGFDRQIRWNFPSPTTPGTVSSTDYEAYTYDAVGNRLSLRKRDGSTLSYQYDNLNRLIRKTVPERGDLPASATRDVFYGYDLRNLPLYARFDSATGEGVTNTYDAFGRQLTSSINMNGVTRTLGYQYDTGSRRTRLTYPDSAYVTFEYDPSAHLTAVRENGTIYAASFGYDPFQRVIAESTGGAWTSWSYDASSRLAGLHIEMVGTGADQDLTFAYNPASQMATRGSANDSYASNTAYNVNRNYTVNGLNQYTAAGGASFTYDANGNLIGDGTNTYKYDIENRMYQVTGGVTGYIVYDPLGRIFEYTGNGGITHQFLWDGDALVAEYSVNAGGTMLRRYVHGGGAGDDPLMWYEGASLSSGRSLFANHQGSIVAISNVSGATVAINAYDPWGIPNATNLGRFQYTGQIWLPEIGIYSYKARMYSPTLGRLFQTDPIGYDDQINLYAYVGNDPVNRLDPSGTEIVLAGHSIFGGVTHMKWIMIPENQNLYRNNPIFQNRLPDGRRYATLGGGPEGGQLVSNLNRPTDLDQRANNYERVMEPPRGLTEDQTIARMIAADSYYGDDLDYDLYPNGLFGQGTDGYNSNSYARTIGEEVGFTNLPNFNARVVPGWNKRIPTRNFYREEIRSTVTGSRIPR